MLGILGEHGVRAALALCAQSSPRTAKWYQAKGLARRQMLGSQQLIAELVGICLPRRRRFLECSPRTAIARSAHRQASDLAARDLSITDSRPGMDRSEVQARPHAGFAGVGAAGWAVLSSGEPSRFTNFF